MKRPAEVVVVGAGISGLSVAYWLSRAGIKVTVLEGQPWVGGTMRTFHDGGWLIEAGPNSALETTPLIADLLADLGISGSRVYAAPSSDKRYIVRGGELHPLPMSPASFIGTSLWTWRGKLRLGAELFIGRGKNEESIAAFVARRLGREFLDYAINPFIAGVYAGNPDELSVRAALPKLYALEEKYGGLIRGMIAGAGERRRREEIAKVRARMFSFEKGMETLPLGIAGKLGRKVRVREKVVSVVPPLRGRGGSFRIVSRTGSLRADAVILSAPAYAAADLVAPFAPELSGMLRGISYPPVTQVFLGYRADQVPRPLDGFGFLVPELEGRRILGSIWSSSLFAGRAPGGRIAFTSFVGGARQPEMALLGDDELSVAVAEELRSLIGIVGTFSYRRVTRWSKAIPQYHIGYHHTLEAIDLTERAHPGIFFCSNYRGGISVGDCIISARRMTERIIEFTA